ncbi:MAG: cell division ATP-binding protein FtsE [Robiginitomaculum sp.]|nr:MAG: cell division ATP-binding protein FtsE [Robiginitomaculum sp.]
MITPQIHTSDLEHKDECIAFERVSFSYQGGDNILKNLSFSLKQGSLNFVTGPSGAGKTSLLKLMYLHMRPKSGQINVFGQNTGMLDLLQIPPLKRRMGVVLQDFSLVDHLNVFENIVLPLRVTATPRADYVQDAISLLQWVGLGDHMAAMPETLSGGQAQRAAIARAIISKPDILIADEPTGNVDHNIGQRLIRLFVELNRLGTTVIIATHDTKLIPADATILRLNNGTLLQERMQS